MTYLKTILLLFLFPIHVYAQDLTGVWTGFLETGDQKVPYELVISGGKKSLSGYSMIVFTFDGVENVGVKTMDIKVKRASIQIVDGDLIYDNYNTPPRHVKLYADLAWVGRDTTMTLAGTFATRSLDMRTSIHENSFKGVVHLQKRNVLSKTKLTDKLKEMDLLNQLSLTQPVKKVEEQKIASVVPPSQVSTETKTNESIKNTKSKSKESSFKNKVESAKPSDKLIEPPKPHVVVPAADIANRNTAVLQTVSFKSDSLRLTLYDNGEVDGDTVTVVLNGQPIISRAGLTAKGMTMAISTSDLRDSSELIMYAENLGRIPPNTGLLIVQDGVDRYQIRFSGDLQNNSAIILRRKH
jgi:hypothetical protein